VIASARTWVGLAAVAFVATFALLVLPLASGTFMSVGPIDFDCGSVLEPVSYGAGTRFEDAAAATCAEERTELRWLAIGAAAVGVGLLAAGAVTWSRHGDRLPVAA
jgi:hypothetical protein